jgi:hypothetical protein
VRSASKDSLPAIVGRVAACYVKARYVKAAVMQTRVFR